MITRPKVFLDAKFGAPSSEEVDDSNLNQIKQDENPDFKEDAPPGAELPEAKEGDFADDLAFELEGEESPEPKKDQKSEAERLAEAEKEWLEKEKVYKPGLIESQEDLAKSYRHLEHHMSSTRRTDKPEPPSEPDPKATFQGLIEDIGSEDPAVRARAVVQISNAVNSRNSNEVRELRKEFFKKDNEEQYGVIESELDNIETQNPGIAFKDAVDLARGRKFDDLQKLTLDKGSLAAQKREQQRQLALREQPGGIRTGPVDVTTELNKVANDRSLSPSERREKMANIMDAHSG